MKNKNKAVWGTRFNKATSKIFEKIGASIDTDKRLFEEDIFGSIVHTQMLIKQKIIKRKKIIIISSHALKIFKKVISKGVEQGIKSQSHAKMLPEYKGLSLRKLGMKHKKL